MSTTLTNDNCFVSESEAVAFSELMLNITAWTEPLSDTQKKALLMATDKINNTFSFQYLKVDPNQPLEFPRYLPVYTTINTGLKPYIVNGVYYEERTPVEIKKAVVYEAIAIINYSSSVHITNQQLGIKSLSFQGDSVSYTATKTKGLLSIEAYNLISKWVGVPKIV